MSVLEVYTADRNSNSFWKKVVTLRSFKVPLK